MADFGIWMTNTKPAPQIIPVSLPVEDIRRSAANMNQLQARRLLGGYWRAQTARIANASSTKDVDHPLLEFFSGGFRRIERQMKHAMEIYVDQHIAGRWAINNDGVGPIIAASLLAFIDLDKCGDNPQKIWRYAGLDPSSKWLCYTDVDPQIAASKLLFGKKLKQNHIEWLTKLYNKKYENVINLATKHGQGEVTWESLRSSLVVRPWNPELKVVCHYLGKGIRRKNHYPNFLYGQLYQQRKAYEYQQNADGENEDQALQIYRDTPWKDTSPESVCRTYKSGVLPPFHIDQRTIRWVAKIFLVHFHQILYYAKFKKMPKKPFIIRAGTGKGEIICPTWPFKK